MLLTVFGFGVLVMGVMMIVRPLGFADGIAAFAGKTWFHTFEVLSRGVLGIMFVLLSESATHPKIYLGLGLLLCFVSVFLILLGSKRHQQFALKTVKIGSRFRPIGWIVIALGLTLIYFDFS